jgi:hypothetical protein
LSPTQQFVIELIKQGGQAMHDNASILLALLTAFGVGLHLPQPGYVPKPAAKIEGDKKS